MCARSMCVPCACLCVCKRTCVYMRERALLHEAFLGTLLFYIMQKGWRLWPSPLLHGCYEPLIASSCTDILLLFFIPHTAKLAKTTEMVK